MDYYLRSADRQAFVVYAADLAPWLLDLGGVRAGLRTGGGSAADGFACHAIGTVVDAPRQVAFDAATLRADLDRGVRNPALLDYLVETRAARRAVGWHVNLRVWGRNHEAWAALAFGRPRKGAGVARVFPRSPSHVWAGEAPGPVIDPDAADEELRR